MTLADAHDPNGRLRRLRLDPAHLPPDVARVYAAERAALTPEPTVPNPDVPAPKPTPAPAHETSPISSAMNGIHQALDWAKKQADALGQTLTTYRFSKPAAEVATVAEAVLEAALPTALTAGETAVLELLTPAHLQQLAAIVGEINATLVKQFLARVPAPKATK